MIYVHFKRNGLVEQFVCFFPIIIQVQGNRRGKNLSMQIGRVHLHEASLTNKFCHSVIAVYACRPDESLTQMKPCRQQWHNRWRGSMPPPPPPPPRLLTEKFLLTYWEVKRKLKVEKLQNDERTFVLFCILLLTFQNH